MLKFHSCIQDNCNCVRKRLFIVQGLPLCGQSRKVTMGSSFFGDMLITLTERSRDVWKNSAEALSSAISPVAAELPLRDAFDALISSLGEASGIVQAQAIVARWKALDDEGKRAFLDVLQEHFGPDRARLEAAVAAYYKEKTTASITELGAASEPRRQELLRRINLAPGGTATLVEMRALLLSEISHGAAREAVDADFLHLFTSWFNPGFLILKPIDWTSPASVLEKIIKYEAVHDIDGWDELRRRLAPKDRRCFAFFHPQLAEEPLIFVEVALTKSMPSTIAELLKSDRQPIQAEDATTAVFYSISNCQIGLRNVSFGNFLIKQVVQELRRELTNLRFFVTLTPVPKFAQWLESERVNPRYLDTQTLVRLSILDTQNWAESEPGLAALNPAISRAAAVYFLQARSAKGKIIDPVGRFHLGNGARLERINIMANPAPRSHAESHGLMVNYFYELDDIARNHEAFVNRGEVVSSPSVRHLLSGKVPVDRRKSSDSVTDLGSSPPAMSAQAILPGGKIESRGGN